MEAVEPLSGFEVGGQQYVPCPHPPTPKRKGGYTFFLHNYILHIMWKSFFFTFPIYFLHDLELPPRSKFRSVAYETTLEWTEDFWFKCWFFIVFPRTIKTMRDFSSSMDISIPNFKQEYIQLCITIWIFLVCLFPIFPSLTQRNYN